MERFFNICKSIDVTHHINKLKNKIRMILSIDAAKNSDKIQNPLKIKTLQKAGKEGTYLNIVKATYDKPRATIIFKGGKTESISSKIRNKTRVPTLTTVIQHNFRSSSQGNQRRKRNKKNPNWKRRHKNCHCLQMT